VGAVSSFSDVSFPVVLAPPGSIESALVQRSKDFGYDMSVSLQIRFE
jgi:hypothetical protein